VPAIFVVLVAIENDGVPLVREHDLDTQNIQALVDWVSRAPRNARAIQI
jgi:hypothetical protein